jgi:hypothetical protein
VHRMSNKKPKTFICGYMPMDGRMGIEVRLTPEEHHVIRLFERWLTDNTSRCPLCLHKRKNHGKCDICPPCQLDDKSARE